MRSSRLSKGMQKREAKRPVIAVLMMDDSVEFSNRYYEQVLDELAKGGAALHVVALGQPTASQSDEVRNRNQVIAIGTERTGGRRDHVLALTAAAPHDEAARRRSSSTSTSSPTRAPTR